MTGPGFRQQLRMGGILIFMEKPKKRKIVVTAF